ncbi:MAG: GIY-YIG nuclease superfamily protein [Parcubacteria group bacterium GW2011_GWB1_45_7]|nr:MAG: GIY-YIG nuclease superfamily protein [Parcubacteria group bacterium GW2011_GWB1_45_7]
MYFVYILENQNDKFWYIGYTSNLERRILEHQHGKGGRTTSIKNDWHLIYSESYLNNKDARGRELFLKSGAGRRFIKKQLSHYLAEL